MSSSRSVINDMMDQKNFCCEVVREDARLYSMIPDHSFQFYVTVGAKVFMNFCCHRSSDCSCLSDICSDDLSCGISPSIHQSLVCIVSFAQISWGSVHVWKTTGVQNKTFLGKDVRAHLEVTVTRVNFLANPFPISVTLSPGWVRNLLLNMWVFIHFYARFRVSLTSSLTDRQYVHDVTMIKIQRSESFEFRVAMEDLMRWDGDTSNPRAKDMCPARTGRQWRKGKQTIDSRSRSGQHAWQCRPAQRRKKDFFTSSSSLQTLRTVLSSFISGTNPRRQWSMTSVERTAETFIELIPEDDVRQIQEVSDRKESWRHEWGVTMVMNLFWCKHKWFWPFHWARRTKTGWRIQGEGTTEIGEESDVGEISHCTMRDINVMKQMSRILQCIKITPLSSLFEFRETSFCCDTKCRKINFTISKSLVSRCRDRP